jgi:phytoene dehydrogenase-like protein
MAGIAVIGAGMGAMAAAARLAVAGHRVTVLERTDTYGGALRRYAREGFAFDTGPGLLHLPAVYRDLFVKTGREPLEECVELRRVDPDARHVFDDGTAVTLPGFSHGGVGAALDAALGPGAGERWGALLTRARTAWDATRRPLLEEPLGEGAPGLDADPYPALRRRGLLRRRPPTLAEVAADELGDPRLAAMLGGFARAHGLDPARAPASAAVLAYLEHTFGTWYVGGGMRELARAVYDRCVDRGVEFRFGAEVARVTETGGAASGVELAGGGRVGADAVIAPGRPRQEAPGARARFTVLLALRGPRPEGTPHRTLLHRPGRLVTVLRPDDPALVPDGEHESAVLTTTVPPGPVTEPDRLADELTAAADAAGVDLGPRVLWREWRTPSDYEAQTMSPGGLVPPPALAGGAGAWLRDPNLAAPAGVYRAGGWAHPGGGLAHAGMTGAMAAGLLLEGDDWRGSR